MRRKLEIRKAPQRSAEVAQSVTEGAEVGFPELRVGGQGLLLAGLTARHICSTVVP